MAERTQRVSTMRGHYCEQPIDYDGSQLRAHWLLDRFGLAGDAIVAFHGRCDVRRDEIADLADLDGPGIRAARMVHFIWESFGATDLLLAVHRQRLLSAQAAEILRELAPTVTLHRDGDDLYIAQAKLSISIATVSPVSALIHFAVNESPAGAPVPIACLEELAVDSRAFAERLLQRVVAEQDAIAEARAKVRAKGEWR